MRVHCDFPCFILSMKLYSSKCEFPAQVQSFVVQTAAVNRYFIVSCHVRVCPMCVDVTYLTEMCSRVECASTRHCRAVHRRTVLKFVLIEIFKLNQKWTNCYVCPKKLVREKLARSTRRSHQVESCRHLEIGPSLDGRSPSSTVNAVERSPLGGLRPSRPSLHMGYATASP